MSEEVVPPAGDFFVDAAISVWLEDIDLLIIKI
jgi:hypothetical protein